MINHLIEKFDIDANFWDCNPQLKYISPFNRYYKKDRSKEKNFSSKQMWAAALYVDPVRSKFWRMSPDEKKQEILENYLVSARYKWEDLMEIIDAYPKVVLTKAERAFGGWGNKMEERDKFMHSKPYDETTYKMLDVMMEKTASMWAAYEKVKQNLIEEQTKSVVKGGRTESKSERGVI